MKDKGKALWVGPDGNGSSGKGKALWDRPDGSTSSGKGKALWIGSDGNSSSLGHPLSGISPLAGTGGNADAVDLNLSLSLGGFPRLNNGDKDRKIKGLATASYLPDKNRKLKGLATASSLPTLYEDEEGEYGKFSPIRSSSLPNETNVPYVMIKPDSQPMLLPQTATTGIEIYYVGGSSASAGGSATLPDAVVSCARGGILNALRVVRHSITLPDDHEDSFRKRKEFENMENKAAKRKKIGEAGSSNPIASMKLFGTELMQYTGFGGTKGAGGYRNGTEETQYCGNIMLPYMALNSQGTSKSSAGPSNLPSASPCIRPVPIRPGMVHPRQVSPAAVAPAPQCQRAQVRMDDNMPRVSTFFGPNGRRTYGILYIYHLGGNLRIVCVCHGAFLSPAEFVKHGGGGDVPNPMKYIVVCPEPPYL